MGDLPPETLWIRMQAVLQPLKDQGFCEHFDWRISGPRQYGRDDGRLHVRLYPGFPLGKCWEYDFPTAELTADSAVVIEVLES